MGSVAEFEVGLINDRTKAALQAAKARGVKLDTSGNSLWIGMADTVSVSMSDRGDIADPPDI